MAILTDVIDSFDTKSYTRYVSLGYTKNNSNGFTILPEHLSNGSHQNVEVSCDSGINNKCRKIFYKEWRAVVKQRLRTNNIDFCNYCQKSVEYEGRGNPNVKYTELDDAFFSNIDSPEKAYLLGWVASDGSIAINNSITISIRDYDLKTLEDIRDIICKDLPIKRYKDNMVSFTINSKKICADIMSHLGLEHAGKKSDKVKFPVLTDNLKIYFLRGYFDGDGSVSLHNNVPRVSVSSNSISMLNSIKDFTKEGSVYVGEFSQWQINSGTKAISFLDTLYKDTTVPYLHRKYYRYVDYSEWIPSLGGGKSKVSLNTFAGIVQVNKSNSAAIFPTVEDIHASGIDLHIISKVKHIGENVSMYTTGLKVKPPEGYYFMLVARSSISKTNFSLANAIGIIDENYIGEIMVALRNHGNDEIELPARLVQLILMPKLNVKFIQVDSFENTTRGEGGFGSTGI